MLLSKYRTAESFALAYNPDLQVKCAENVERSFLGDAPSIAILKKTYTKNQVRVWLMAQLENLNTYCGTKNKMNADQMMMLSDIIMTECYYLKASELLLFFHQFKAGKYGELYGSVDPLRVSSALVEFAAYRRDMLFKFESKAQEERRRVEHEERSKRIMTYDEFKKFKKINQLINE